MFTVVVQAHPLDDSYNAALLESVCSGLSDHRVVRLYSGDQIEAAEFADCDELIVVAPTWWGSMPAIMVEWLEGLLGPWIDGSADGSTSPLSNVRQLRVVTSHGSSRLVNMLQGEPGRNFWQRTVLPLCAPGAAFTWQALYKIDRLDDEARRAFLQSV